MDRRTAALEAHGGVRRARRDEAGGPVPLGRRRAADTRAGARAVLGGAHGACGAWRMGRVSRRVAARHRRAHGRHRRPRAGGRAAPPRHAGRAHEAALPCHAPVPPVPPRALRVGEGCVQAAAQRRPLRGARAAGPLLRVVRRFGREEGRERGGPDGVRAAAGRGGGRGPAAVHERHGVQDTPPGRGRRLHEQGNEAGPLPGARPPLHRARCLRLRARRGPAVDVRLQHRRGPARGYLPAGRRTLRGERAGDHLGAGLEDRRQHSQPRAAHPAGGGGCDVGGAVLRFAVPAGHDSGGEVGCGMSHTHTTPTHKYT